MSEEVERRSNRHCYKCGREIGPDDSICAVCNRAGMKVPAASQVHGTMVVAIIAGIAGLAIWGSLALKGVGPYAGQVVGMTADPPDGVQVTVRITNEGTKQGFASCLLSAHDDAGRVLRTHTASMGPITGGSSDEFTERIGGLAAQPASVTISCEG